MADLADLAEQYQRNAIAWDAGHPHLSGEVCQRHAADWLALHTLAHEAVVYVELMGNHWPPEKVVLAEENAVAACRRLAAHLKEPTSA